MDSPHSFDARSLDLTRPEDVEEALLSWTELSHDQLAFLRDHPVHGPRLSLMRRADAWLESRANEVDSPRQAVLECPPAEELYDYGRGPGYAPLSPERRLAIDLHLVDCDACEELVASLLNSPPVPIAADEARAREEERARTEAPGTLPAPARTRRVVRELELVPGGDVGQPKTRTMQEARRARLRRTWIPAAAAAAVLVTGLTWNRFADAGDPVPHRFPAAPVLRGDATGALLFPRDRVLPAAPDLWLRGWAVEPRFEVDVLDGASEYRIEVLRHDGGAFAAGESVLRVSGAGPQLTLSGTTLGPGRYTFEAWAVVDGLDRPLGSRDFQVVADEEVSRALTALADLPEPERSERALAILHEAGYLTDARAFARTLPASPERDAYLARKPGR